jgi:hypothetical protein
MKLLLTLILTLSIISCVEIEVTLPTAARPVVQAYLMPGQAVEVDVKRETIFLDTDTVVNIGNLDISIETSGQGYPLSSTGNGKYTSSELAIEEGGTYKLVFPYYRSQVSATTIIPPKPKDFAQSATVMAVPTFAQGFEDGFPDPIELTWSNPDGRYYLIVVEVAQDTPVQINPDNGFNRPSFSFRNDPTQANRHLLRPQQFQYYALYRIILFEVTEDYAALYQQNGTSSINIKTPATNVTNGLGIFTGVNSDTLHVSITRPD